MAKGPEIPKTDSAEIEILIERLKQNKLEQRDVELIDRSIRFGQNDLGRQFEEGGLRLFQRGLFQRGLLSRWFGDRLF